jgi:hypothetical protein
MSAWTEIVCADITPEWLAMCNRALAEVQAEQRRKDAAKIRRHFGIGDSPVKAHCDPDCDFCRGVSSAADLIDPESEAT